MTFLTENHLRAHLDIELPKMCMSLLRTTMSNKKWLEEVIPLTYDIKRFRDGKKIELPYSQLLNIIETIPAKSRILLHGEAGIGKSTTLSELCISWKDRTALTRRFAHAYLIPIRDIVSPYASPDEIICCDLKIVPQQEEQALRRFIEFNSTSIIWFLDGYDERTSHGNEETTLDKLISGKDATNSTVVVTSREQDANVLSSILKNKIYEIHVKGFDDSDVRDYLEKLPKDWAPSYRDLVVNSSIPRELLKSPLVDAMICYIQQNVDKSSLKGKKDNLKLVSTCSILYAVCGFFLGIKQEKTTGRDLPHYTGYRDPWLSPKMKSIIRTIAKLAFHSTKSWKYNIHITKFTKNKVFEEFLI